MSNCRPGGQAEQRREKGQSEDHDKGGAQASSEVYGVSCGGFGRYLGGDEHCSGELGVGLHHHVASRRVLPVRRVLHKQQQRKAIRACSRRSDVGATVLSKSNATDLDAKDDVVLALHLLQHQRLRLLGSLPRHHQPVNQPILARGFGLCPASCLTCCSALCCSLRCRSLLGALRRPGVSMTIMLGQNRYCTTITQHRETAHIDERGQSLAPRQQHGHG